MIKTLVTSWESNKDVIRKELTETLTKYYDDKLDFYFDYELLVRILFSNLKVTDKKYDDEYYSFEIDNMVVIDNGHYQGTMIYVIPSNCYQPSVGNHYYTHNYYGSCSGCDLLQHILMSTGDNIEEGVDDLMGLCLNLVQRTHRMED